MRMRRSRQVAVLECVDTTVFERLIRYSENDLPELPRAFEMKLRTGGILERKY